MRGFLLENSEMTSEHVRAARALLRWEQKELAEKSGVSLPTIKRLETQPGILGAYAGTVAAIRRTLEDQGIEFQNEDACGSRIRQTEKHKEFLPSLR
jgi:predicted transcriptional regulator